MKDYDLLQEGDDWIVMSWNPISGGWLKTVTYHYDSWGLATKLAAEDYITNRRVANEFRSKLFLSKTKELFYEHSAEG